MPIRPLHRDAILAELADRIAGLDAARPRVLLDGPPPTVPAGWAADLGAQLELRGRPVLVADTADWLRPASLRYERGRTDPDAFLDERIDAPALRRELLDPAGPGGSGRVLPRWWDPATDRSARARYVVLDLRAVVLLHGGPALGLGLPVELRVRLHMSAAALRRRMPDDLQWALPAWARQEQERADVTVLLDDPRRPALG